MAPEVDYILNGQATGSVAQQLMASGFDVNALRPYIGPDGNSYISRLNVNSGEYEGLVTNTPASLRFQDWRLIDEAIIRVAKPRLRAIADLRGRGLAVTLPNGMAHTVFSYENMSDISPAILSMDGIRESERDRPMFDIVNLPLPIIHKDFSFSARQVMASRNGGTPLDTATAELAARRVAEVAEQLTLGVAASYSYAGGTVYGYTNFPSRITFSMTNPVSGGGWTPSTTINEVLSMRTKSQLAFHYGPWIIYNSPLWDLYLDGDYKANWGTTTLRERLKMIDNIEDVRTLDYLTGYQMIMVQMTTDVVREVVGMDITTLQWESKGGMQLNFKVMAIMVPQLRTDQNGNTGIIHGSA